MISQVKNFDELPAALTVWPGLGEALGVSRPTAYKMVREPGFPVIRVLNKRLVVPKDLLLKYLEAKAEEGFKAQGYVG